MVQIVPQERPDLGFSCGCRVEEVEKSPCMKIVDEVQLPMGLEQAWVNELHVELESAAQELPTLSAAALELAELAVSGEDNAELVGAHFSPEEWSRVHRVSLGVDNLRSSQDPPRLPSPRPLDGLASASASS